MKGSLKSTLAVSLTNFLDAGAIVAGASGLTLWQGYLGLTEAHLGWLNFISANCMGTALGAIIGGFLADKYGRKFIYTYNLLVYMTGMLLVALSVNFAMLLAGFLVTGISVGIGVPAAWTYISESSEDNNRGRNICISQMSWAFGPMMVLLLGMCFAPDGYLYAWVEALAHAIGGADLSVQAVQVFSSRILFSVLFVVAFVAWNMQRRLQESAEWTASKAQAAARGEDNSVLHSLRMLFANRIAVRTLTYLTAIYLFWGLVASVMGFFQPHIYETAGGVSNELANWMSCIGWAITVVTTFVLSFIIDRMSHRVLYVVGLLFAIGAWLIIVTVGVNGMAGLWLFSVLWGIQAGVSVQIFYALWGSELFPAKFRAGAQGFMYFLLRSAFAFWGLVFTYIYGEHGEGFTLAAYCMIGLLVVSLVVGVIGCPNTRGKSLAQITRERYGSDHC